MAYGKHLVILDAAIRFMIDIVGIDRATKGRKLQLICIHTYIYLIHVHISIASMKHDGLP